MKVVFHLPSSLIPPSVGELSNFQTFKLSTNPEPGTRNAELFLVPRPTFCRRTSNFQLSTFNFQRSNVQTFNEPETRNPEPETRNPKLLLILRRRFRGGMKVDRRKGLFDHLHHPVAFRQEDRTVLFVVDDRVGAAGHELLQLGR